MEAYSDFKVISVESNGDCRRYRAKITLPYGEFLDISLPWCSIYVGLSFEAIQYKNNQKWKKPKLKGISMHTYCIMCVARLISEIIAHYLSNTSKMYSKWINSERYMDKWLQSWKRNN